MTNAAHEQREALGLRLRELRRDAGLTGRGLARLAGWHESKTSRIEYGKQTPTEADLRAWCAHTGSMEQLPDLIATLRNIQAAYLEWRRLLGTGTQRRQRLSVKLESRANAMRWYEPCAVPGLLQTAEYAEVVLRKVIDFYGVPDDIDAGVAARMERQRVLYQGDHRFSFIIAEQAIQTTVGDNSVMLGQLDRLLAVMTLPRVKLGIVPASANYEAPATNGFIIFDNRLVQVETVTAELTITQPREIALYGKMFATLSEQAMHGDMARELIRKALAARSG
ncbi:helix-turn-helix transcriptional regulator [Nocardia sp. CDC159]|uniref:Helix-turn-helix transcriptional regulator n=1 Tax=Nocardia pulmonis TaxID=2951408 RepID=A0A9X2IYL8_9NOCA|nr:MULTISPECIES: DUF5753 domain-containing protein [Nocardia]MCM6775794.1 helix-turn-helix transcriptional regulator [Nocardia pulmonis]MCM6788230.1 helix-turn-helix transcriptional regulator [Nocardia sp. CDC159]